MYAAIAARAGQRREQSGMLLVAHENLVAGAQVEAGEHGVDAVGGRAGKRHLLGLAPEQRGVGGPHRVREREGRGEVVLTRAAVAAFEVEPLARRVERTLWRRPR